MGSLVLTKPNFQARSPRKNSDRIQGATIWRSVTRAKLVNLQEVLNLAKQLSPVDKVRLMQQMAFELENELRDKPSPTQHHHQPPQEPPKWDMSANQGHRPSAPNIDPSRWDDWASFPD